MFTHGHRNSMDPQWDRLLVPLPVHLHFQILGSVI